MISETDLDFYRFTSSTTIFGLNKSVICIFIEIHREPFCLYRLSRYASSLNSPLFPD